MRNDLSPVPVSPQAPTAAPMSPKDLPDPVQVYQALARTCLADAPQEDSHQLDKEIAWIMATYDGYPSSAIKYAMQEASLYLAQSGGDASTYVEHTVDEALRANPYGETPLGWGV